MHGLRSALLLAAIAGCPLPGRADPVKPVQPETDVVQKTPRKASPPVLELRVRARPELIATLVAVILVEVGGVVLGNELTPDACRWCETNSIDDRTRDALRWSNTDLADDLSDVTGYVLGPGVAVGLMAAIAVREGRPSEWVDNSIMVGESFVAAALLNHIAKFSFARERPFVSDLPPTGEDGDRPFDDNLSFYSGHTTRAFAMAVSAGTIASMRDYRWAPVVWAAGGVLAGTTGYLRLASDRHHLTDVLVGGLIGSAIGVAVPWIHRAQVGPDLVIAFEPTRGGGLFTARAPW